MIKDVIEIFKNDIKTIKNNLVVIIVLMVIICIPSLYALLNIQATWDPYGETSNIKVAVAAEDVGYTYNGTHYNVGNVLVDELKNNTKFNWQFVDKKTALDRVKNGEYYAAIIIPSNFSQELLSISTSNPHQAKIEYIANDKLSPIAPKITSNGADEIQEKINNEVVKTIDGIIFGKLKDVGELAKENKAQFLKTRAFVNELNGKLDDIDTTIAEANSVMDTVNGIWPKISAVLPEIQKNSNYIRKTYDSLYAQITADPQKALVTVQDMESKVQETITALEYQHAVLTSLYNATGDQQLKPIIAQLEDNIAKANKVLAALKEVEVAIKDGKNPEGKLAELKTLIDEMDNAINLLANNREIINQKINEASAKLDLVNSEWPAFRKAIPIAATKLNSINEDDIDKLIAFSDTDLDDVKSYFQSPVELEKEHMYPVDNYGSALSPFYMALSLWIGCLMAVAMITTRVKSKKKYHGISAYLGRMGIFLIIGILQSLLVSLGALYLDVQVSSALLFILTSLFIGMCFMIIMYSLTSAFGNVGKVLAIILLVLQISAAGGTFPVEVLSPSFRVIHPFLPFTYAISALREVIAGVLWSNYWHCIGILAIFSALAFVLTLLIKEKLSKRTEWTEEKLKESGLF